MQYNMLSKLLEIIFRKKIKMVHELCFHKYRRYSDGIDFFIINLTSDFYDGDHKPSFHFEFVILNFLLEFSIYNIYHLTAKDRLMQSYRYE